MGGPNRFGATPHAGPRGAGGGFRGSLRRPSARPCGVRRRAAGARTDAGGGGTGSDVSPKEVAALRAKLKEMNEKFTHCKRAKERVEADKVAIWQEMSEVVQVRAWQSNACSTQRTMRHPC